MKKNKILVCIVVSTLVLVGLVVSSTKWITKKASSEAEEKDVIAEPVIDENGEILEANDIHPLPKQMLFSTPSAQSDAITVSANYAPIDADVIKLNWNIVFKNAESEWAKGKNVSDYILIEANNTTCSVRCLKEFGEPIQLICSSRYDPSIKASCTLNYGKRIISRMFELELHEYYHYNESNGNYYVSFVDNLVIEFNLSNENNSTYGIGTVPLCPTEKYYLKTEDSLIGFLSTHIEEFALLDVINPTIAEIGELDMNMEYLFELMGVHPMNMVGYERLFYDMLPDYIYNHPDTPIFSIVLELWYNGEIINSFEYPICALEWNYGMRVQSISLNQNQICF